MIQNEFWIETDPRVLIHDSVTDNNDVNDNNYDNNSNNNNGSWNDALQRVKIK
jgi:hypothetical protein